MLSPGDFLNLSIALFFLFTEWIFRSLARVICFFLPKSVQLFIECSLESVLRLVKVDTEPYNEKRDYDTGKLIRSHGYAVEEYTIETKDGYLITIHRLPRRHSECEPRDSGDKTSMPPRPPILIMHGFLECSEIWVAPGPRRSLPYLLVEEGYDVWLGNVRGNRYGYKHVSLGTRSYEFWKFGMDEMVRYDLPAIIDKMLRVNGSERFSYLGFSQGTGLGFGLFSTNLDIAQKVDHFIALAPAARVTGVKLAFIDTLMRCDPNIIYLMFGRRRLLGMTIFWRAMLPSSTYVKLIDQSTKSLFGWHMKNIAEEDKPRLYGHLYSVGSVRTMVHWFQTIAAGRFQMYDDEANGTRSYASHVPPEYPIRQIRVPTALFYGGSDFLCDIPWLMEQFKDTPLYTMCIPEYEHLDFQFSNTAHTRVYPVVMELLRSRHMFQRRESVINGDEKASELNGISTDKPVMNENLHSL